MRERKKKKKMNDVNRKNVEWKKGMINNSNYMEKRIWMKKYGKKKGKQQ